MKTKIKNIPGLHTKARIVKPGKKLLEKITTGKTWDDLHVDDATKKDLNEIGTWILNEKTFGNEAMNEHKVLFVGKTKTGKKLSAKLLGKLYNADVYKIDLSKVLSKYIGETQKNLQQVFDNSIKKNPILFFDEADALFGKRTDVKDAHDRYSELNISYLLQKVNEYPHLVIFNTKKYDDASNTITQHFNKIIHFKKPS